MRLIDADDAVMRLRQAEKAMEVVSVAGLKVIDISAVPQFLEMLPTIDAVPVVRCKDCKHMAVVGVGFRWCKAWERIQTMGDDGFCCFAERRIDD